jgi:hypothetical protein
MGFKRFWLLCAIVQLWRNVGMLYVARCAGVALLIHSESIEERNPLDLGMDGVFDSYRAAESR